jgi:thymidylate synthase
MNWTSGWIRTLLTRKPTAKSATISLLRPGYADLGHVLCITSIDFKIREGRLNVCYFARSQDLLKKNFADNLAIHAIGQKLAADLGIQPGSVSAFIASGHVHASDAARMRAVDPVASPARLAFGEAS